MTVNNSMNRTTVSVSVLLSIYNAEKYVGMAIESILNQTYTNFELIAVDDCSTDNSWQIVRKYMSIDSRIIAIRNHTNLGGCETLNVGLKIAKGKYIARLDNDDWSYPYRLERQISFLESHPSVGIVGGAMEIMNESGQLIGKRTYNITDKEIRRHIFRYSPFAHPLVMIRKSVLDEIGCYNPLFAPADDYELYFRIGIVSQFANLSDVLMRYRVVPDSITSKQTRKMELATIKTRNRYVNNPNYDPTYIDYIYNILHYLSIFLIPSRTKIYLFNLLRNS